MAWVKTGTTYTKTVKESDVPTKIVAGETDKFRPTVYMSKWSDEAWVKLTIPLNVTSEVESVTDDIISFTFANNTFRFYTKPDESLEYEIVLSKRPPGINSWTFNIDFPSGVEFFYQPELTAEQIAQGYNRPDDVIGSYAVYLNKANNQYKTGKFCHIFRPQLTDALGGKIWANLSIDSIAKTLTISVDSNWLKDATYPVTIDPTIGYTTLGASNYLPGGAYKCVTRQFNAATLDGTASTIYCGTHQADYQIKAAVYTAWTAGNRIAGSHVTLTSVAAGFCSAAVSFSVTNGTSYFPSYCIQGSAGAAGIRYDTVGSHTGGYDGGATYANEMLDPCQTMTDSDLNHSVYFEYAAAGGTHYTEDISHDGSWHTMTTATLSRAADYKRKVTHS